MSTGFVKRAVIGLVISSYGLATGVDIKGSHDHPLITRYADSHIIRYQTSDFGKIDIPNGTSFYNAEKNQKIVHPRKKLEGKLTSIQYQLNEQRPFIEIYRNFQSSMERAGFQIEFRCENSQSCGPMFGSQFLREGGVERYKNLSINISANSLKNGTRYAYLHGHKKAGENEVHISVLVAENHKGDKPANIVLDIVETGSIKDNLISIDPQFLSQSLTASGKVVLQGVFFDTNKAEVKSESATALKAIADYLAQNQKAKVFIVGHTDNDGSYQHNVELSSRRAAAVAAALVKTHKIEDGRLQAIGVGPVSPIGSNASEEGKATNRRVEMVLR